MLSDENVTARASQINAWIKRHKDKGIAVTSDMQWNKIKDLWPTLSELDREKIFQRSK